MANTKLLRDLSMLILRLGSIGVRHLDNSRRLKYGHFGAFRSRRPPLHKTVGLAVVSVHYDLDEALAQGYDTLVVADADSRVLEAAHVRLTTRGGQGAVREAAAWILERAGRRLGEERRDLRVARVFVTAISGFVGGYLAQELLRRRHPIAERVRHTHRLLSFDTETGILV